MNRHIVLAITGASGAIYGVRLLEELLAAGNRVSLLISRCGFIVLKEELGLELSGDARAVNALLLETFSTATNSLVYYDADDFFAPVASGSAAAEAMIIAPCSMGSVARIAAGLSGNLIERTADVMIKENRPLLLMPRETPLSAIHLENMLKLSRLGVKMVAAMPGFYTRPQTLDDAVNFMVGKMLDQLGIEHQLFERWGRSLI